MANKFNKLDFKLGIQTKFLWKTFETLDSISIDETFWRNMQGMKTGYLLDTQWRSSNENKCLY